MVTWIKALSRTRNQIGGALRKVFSRTPRVEDVSFEELEEGLLKSDVPVQLALQLVGDLRRSYDGLHVPRKQVLQKLLIDMLGASGPYQWAKRPEPLTILVVGVNGSGKTTTCAKLAHLARAHGLDPLLGAADTFRAAGSDQLKMWAEDIGCDVVGGKQGSDAAAVAYDSLDAAIARKKDVLIVDTAGRMHTREPLMRELQKARNALSKKLPGAPHETWIVLDATIGQNAILQARTFHELVPLTGAIVAKLDGSAKAGFVFSVARELGVPIRFAGLGEGKDDLVPFDSEQFTGALLDINAVPEGSIAG